MTEGQDWARVTRERESEREKGGEGRRERELSQVTKP